MILEVQRRMCDSCIYRPDSTLDIAQLEAAIADPKMRGFFTGYRACHRCRPYRWPQSFSWTAPELVCRAVSLILDGALDHGSEADLGAKAID